MSDVTQRPFGFWTATALIVGGMIGSGIFLLPVAIAPYGWIGVVAWIVSILGAVTIGYAIARLGQAMPEETGAVAITARVLGPVVGVLVGWAYWISTWTTIAAIAGAAVSYLAVFAPILTARPINGALATIALIWLFTASNLFGARTAGKVQVVTTIIKLVPLFAVIAILAWLGGSGTARLPSWPGTSTGYAGLTAAITLTLFPLLGFEGAGMISERVRDPARTVMRATIIGTIVTGLLYVLVSSGIAFALPTDRLLASSAPFALFVETYIGASAGKAVAAFAAVAAIGALNGWVLLQGEVPLGMARAGLLPRWFGQVNARDVPVRVLILSSILASLLVASTASRSLSGAFQFAALLTTCTVLWLYAAVCVSALRRGLARTPAALGLAFTGWAMVGAGLEASGWGLVLTVTGLPVYWWAKRARRE